MHWYDCLLTVFVWNLVGCFILMVVHSTQIKGAIYMADGWEFVNPVHIYRYNKVNWFGAIIVALIYNAFCPIGSVCYWFYKLCTVGRK